MVIGCKMPRKNVICVISSCSCCTINYFIYCFKKLDAEQMELLTGSPGASNPLWLSLSCEELRVFGVFETITRHIRSLPVTLKELLQFIINRLTNEDQENNIHKVFYFCMTAPTVFYYKGGRPTRRVSDFSCPITT